MALKQSRMTSRDSPMSRKFFSFPSTNKSRAQAIPIKLRLRDGIDFRWPSECGMSVFDNTFIPEFVTQTDDIVLVRFSDERGGILQLQEEGIVNWELRMVVGSDDWSVRNDKKSDRWDGYIYARHGGTHHSGWWWQRSKKSAFVKCQPGVSIEAEYVRYAVYVRSRNSTAEHMKQRYLRCLGGQAAVYCSDHLVPFITAPDDSSQCCCRSVPSEPTMRKEWRSVDNNKCIKPAKYICPRDGCKSATCQDHQMHLQEKMSNGCYLLNVQSCRKAINPGIDNPATTGFAEINAIDEDGKDDEESDDSSVDSSSTSEGRSKEDDGTDNHSAFGPTEPHEFMLDLFQDDYLDDDEDSSSDESSEEDDDDDMDDDNPPLRSNQRNTTTEHIRKKRKRSSRLVQNLLSTAATDDDAPLSVNLVTDDPKIASAPLHVVFNRQGHC